MEANKDFNKNFLADTSRNFTLKQCSTLLEPLYKNVDDYEKILGDNVKKISNLQEMLYASHCHAVLIIFQGMDTAGKDSVIKHVLSGVNPQGCQVHSFKHPSQNELDHDFLWRANMFLPERGKIGVFNRSHYEDVLIVRVHPEISQSENLPSKSEKNMDKWKQRFESINNFENHLHKSGTKIIKFFLHLSKDEQHKRFLKRIDQEDKNWKFNKGDIKERGFWDEYQKAYEQCFLHTSTQFAPWFIVPADDKKNTRLIVSNIILYELEKLNLKYPDFNQTKKDELEECRKRLISED